MSKADLGPGELFMPNLGYSGTQKPPRSQNFLSPTSSMGQRGHCARY